MRKRVQVALAISFLVLVGVIGWQVFEPREAVYQGKTLSSWLSGYRRNVFQVGGPPRLAEFIPTNADAAVLQAGTTELPTLLRMLRARDSALKLELIYLAKRQHLIKIEYTPAETLNWAALHAFQVLGAKAQSAVPGLIKIVNQRLSPPSQTCALGSLGAIGPPAKEAIPSLLQWVTNADSHLRLGVIVALGRVHAEPDRVVPVLTNALHDSYDLVRINAAGALGEFGPDATPAVPALVEFLNAQNDSLVKSWVAAALKKIDREAAAKAGVK